MQILAPKPIKPTATATDPTPANSPTMNSRLVRKDPTKPKKNQNTKIHQNGKTEENKFKGMPILAIHFWTRSLHLTG